MNSVGVRRHPIRRTSGNPGVRHWNADRWNRRTLGYTRRVPQPPDPKRSTVTLLIRDVAAGDRGASGQLFELVYSELRTIAASQLGRERPDHTLQPTALVHEAFLKLVDEEAVGALGRREFFGAVAVAMRRILIDHARTSKRLKRGGGSAKQALLSDPSAEPTLDSSDVLALDEALTELASHDERKARLVELRFFGGLTVVQACEVMEISRATADREWRTARAWLAARLMADGSDPDVG